MTRVTLGEFKLAARNRRLRRSDPTMDEPVPTPMPTAGSAIRRFHRDGATAAITQLNGSFDRSAYWGPTGPPSPRGWANAIRECLQTYVNYASQDNRPALMTPVTTDVQVGGNTIGVSLDVVLLDKNGYVGRYLLWDKPALTQKDAEVLASPVVRALKQALGEDRVAGVEIWHLRSGKRVFVDESTALGRSGEIERILNHYLS